MGSRKCFETEIYTMCHIFGVDCNVLAGCNAQFYDTHLNKFGSQIESTLKSH